MHERGEGVSFLARAEAGEERGDDCVEKVADDRCEELGGGGGDFSVDVNEHKEGFVDVGAEFGGAVGGGDPVGGGDAVVDQGGELLRRGVGVGFEQLGFDLGEDVADRFAFFGDFQGEGSFEVWD